MSEGRERAELPGPQHGAPEHRAPLPEHGPDSPAATKSRPRVALFGGTFDPPHRGHLAIARAAAEAFALQTVFFAPTGRQPLKPESPQASFEDRLAMVALACAADPHFAVSNLDAPHPDGAPNYTVQTLALLAGLFPGAELFNIVGADSFATLAHWKEPHRLLALAEWIVVSRPGTDKIVTPGLELSQHELNRVHLLDTIHEEVSATSLRHRLQAGEETDGLIAPAVATYIKSHGLYL